MESNSTRKYIKKVIERAKSAEPYPLEVLHNRHSDIFAEEEALDQKRLTATIAQITLNKYFSQHPEDSIENYIDETA